MTTVKLALTQYLEIEQDLAWAQQKLLPLVKSGRAVDSVLQLHHQIGVILSAWRSAVQTEPSTETIATIKMILFTVATVEIAILKDATEKAEAILARMKDDATWGFPSALKEVSDAEG